MNDDLCKGLCFCCAFIFLAAIIWGQVTPDHNTSHHYSSSYSHYSDSDYSHSDSYDSDYDDDYYYDDYDDYYDSK